MDIVELSLKQLHNELKAGNLTVSDIVGAYKNNFDKTENKIKAFIHTDWDEIEKKAQELTPDKIKNSNSVLQGVPVGIKDVLMTHGVQTTAGSKILEGYKATYTATAVQKLFDAGALMVGKNNCDEFAMGGSTENSGFFPTHNPYDLSRVPGGSSGGSATAVATRQVVFSIGSDTGGSIRQPASFCGVVGLKPTYGRVSRFGLIAMASSLDSVGPITKSVEDAAYVLEAIVGHDSYDSTTTDSKPEKYTDAIDRSVKGMKIGVPKQIDLASLSSEVQEQFQQSIDWLKDSGVEVVEIDLQHLKDALAVYYVIMPAEVSSNMAKFDGIRFGQTADKADDLLSFYMKTRGEYLGAEVKRRIMMGTYVLSSGYMDEYYVKAQKVRRIIANEVKQAFGDVDAFFLPTTPTPAFEIGEKTMNPIDMYLSDIYTVIANIVGIPGISVPSGMIGELPFGVQFLGKHFDEATILALANVIEKKRGNLPQPKILSNL